MQTIKFNLNNNYKLVPAGERELTITTCDPTPSGNPTGVKMVYTDKEGGTISETISFDKALWKISSLCSVCLNAKDGQEMSVKEMCDSLKGKTVKCEVIHNQGTKARDDGTFPTFANVKSFIECVELVKESDIPANMTADENPRSSILAGL